MNNRSNWLDESDSLFPLTERQCGTCGEIRPMSMFYTDMEKRKSAKRGARWLSSCRDCHRVKNARYRAPRQQMIDKIKTDSGCVDCGIREPDHPEIYDFDHLPGFEKIDNIAKFLTKGREEDLMAEIAKCEVVCSNCHRKRTRARVANSFGKSRGPEAPRVNPRQN